MRLTQQASPAAELSLTSGGQLASMIKPLAGLVPWRYQITWRTSTTPKHHHHFCIRCGPSFLNLRKRGHTVVEFID